MRRAFNFRTGISLVRHGVLPGKPVTSGSRSIIFEYSYAWRTMLDGAPCCTKMRYGNIDPTLGYAIMINTLKHRVSYVSKRLSRVFIQIQGMPTLQIFDPWVFCLPGSWLHGKYAFRRRSLKRFRTPKASPIGAPISPRPIWTASKEIRRPTIWAIWRKKWSILEPIRNTDRTPLSLRCMVKS